MRRASTRGALRTLAWALGLWLLLAAAGSAHAACELRPGVLSAAVLGDEDGIGGTGFDGGDDGIGGTGILGTVTGFGSICVNGLRIDYDPDVRVLANGVEASANSLALGQVVWVRAELRDEELWAERISIVSAVVGPITSVESDGQRLEVSGHRVSVPLDAIFAGGIESRVSLSMGQRVIVSGLAGQEGIVASRIEVAPPETPDSFDAMQIEDLLARARGLNRLSVEGYVHERSAVTRFRIQGLEVDARALRPQLEALGLKARVWVSGAVTEGATLRAERISVRPAPVERPTPPERPPGAGVDKPRQSGTRPVVRPERPGRPDRAERPRLDRPELPERPEVIERPPAIERPPILDRAETTSPVN